MIRFATEIEQIETAVLVDTFQACPTTVPHPLAVHQANGCTWGVTRGIDDVGWSQFFNQVLALGVSQPATQELVDQIVTTYNDAHIPFIINLSPHAQPTHLPVWLTAKGLTPAFHLAQCVRDVAPLPILPSAFDIRTVTAADAALFVDKAAIGLPQFLHHWIAALVGRPGWHHYLAFDGDTAVAGAALFVREQIGYLTWAGTQPDHRGRGAQSALIAHRIHEATALGCQLIVAETAEDDPDHPSGSCRNLMRAGFEIAYLKHMYA